MAFNVKTAALLVSALSMAGGTAFFAQTWIESERADIMASLPTPEPVEVEEVVLDQIMVAARDIPAGSFITEEHLKWQPWPEESMVDGYFIKGEELSEDAEPSEDAPLTIADLAGTVARQGLHAGQPITDPQLVRPGERGFLAAVVTPGNRAVSVPIDATSGISGFVFPGDRVDMIHAVNLKVEEEDEDGDEKRRNIRFTQTLLQDVRVLAIDQMVDNADAEVRVAKTATFEVTPKQAEKVALALQTGRISLSLRSIAKDDQVDPRNGEALFEHMATALEAQKTEASERSYTVETDIYQFIPPQAVARPAPQRAARSVQVVRGNQVENKSF